MEQTAVEWLAERIQSDKIFNFENVLNKAKEMEKQQIIDFALWFNNRDNSYKSYTEIVEQYYNEIFKSEII